MFLPFFGWDAIVSINLKEHIFSYRTIKKIIYGTIFFKRSWEEGRIFCEGKCRNLSILKSLFGWETAYRKATLSKHFRQVVHNSYL